MEINPNNKYAYRKKRRLFYEMNRHKISIEKLSRQSTLESLNAIFFFETYLESKNTEYLDKAISIDPKYEKALIQKATLLYNANSFNECIQHLDRVLKLDPYCEDINVYFMKADSYFKQNKLYDATEWIQKAIEIDPENDKAIELRYEIEIHNVYFFEVIL